MVTTKDFELGQYVFSKAGRDSGRPFIVIKVVDENFLMIVDGDLRKVDNPKLKKVKHLRMIDDVSLIVKDKIIKGEKISNALVRREIDKLGLV
ncbi:MAG: KOW domain-containing RNA-binding protein [Firmicutes bacterium]|jgi:ribosomal protein L14E/L6E/L27E|nr:KOW domain-containing RNA-binding protein [Bacillota bacterium]